MSKLPSYVGIHEIALALGVSRQRAHNLAAYKSFPAPVAGLAMGRVWRTRDVRAWAASRNRTWHDYGPLGDVGVDPNLMKEDDDA